MFLVFGCNSFTIRYLQPFLLVIWCESQDIHYVTIHKHEMSFKAVDPTKVRPTF